MKQVSTLILLLTMSFAAFSQKTTHAFSTNPYEYVLIEITDLMGKTDEYVRAAMDARYEKEYNKQPYKISYFRKTDGQALIFIYRGDFADKDMLVAGFLENRGGGEFLIYDGVKGGTWGYIENDKDASAMVADGKNTYLLMSR